MTSSIKNTLALIGISLASLIGCIDFTIVNTAIPAIQHGLKADINNLQWVINIFILALCSFMVISGRLGDLYGRRKMLYFGMIIFALASLGAGLAFNMTSMIIFRGLQGFAATFMYTASGAIISHTFPEDQRGKAMGILFGINGLGLALGPVLGGVLISLLSWRWVFFVNLPIIFLSLMICFWTVQESKSSEPNQTIDWFGAVFLALGLSCLVLALIQGSSWGWLGLKNIVLYLAGLISLINLYLTEIKHRSPIIDFHLFANRNFFGSSIASFGLAFFYVPAFFLMPQYLHNIRGQESGMIGLSMLATTAMIVLLSPMAGKLADKFGTKWVMVLGLIFLALSAALQSQFSIYPVTSSLIYVLFAFAVMGIGWSGILGPSTTTAVQSVPTSHAGVAMGSSWTIHNMGGTIGIAIGMAVYQIFSNTFLQGYSASMVLLVISSLMAAGLVSVISVQRNK